jgi:hypothetical protein
MVLGRYYLHLANMDDATLVFVSLTKLYTMACVRRHEKAALDLENLGGSFETKTKRTRTVRRSGALV